MSNFLKNTSDKLKKPIVAAMSLAALTGCAAQADTDRYSENILPNAVGIDLCDGAAVRDAPYRSNKPDMFEEGVKVLEVDFGNAPEGACFRIPASAVYLATEPNNGNWYGISEGDLARGLTDTKLNPKEESNILWINQQRANPVVLPSKSK